MNKSREAKGNASYVETNFINVLLQAKQEALNELRNAHPNQEISLLLPDHCSEHLEKINQV